MSDEQTLSINQNRYKLLEIFCQYDLGNLSQDLLEERMRAMHIKPTQAYQTYMRKQCGSLKFNEFVKVLSISDDQIVNDMMTDAHLEQEFAAKCDAPRSRGIGSFNTDQSIYTRTRDFLKWKSAKDIHRNDETLAHTMGHLEATEFSANRRNSLTSANVQQALSPKGSKLRVHTDAEPRDSDDAAAVDDEKSAPIKHLCKLYCRGLIDILELERRIKECGTELNAHQLKIMGKAKIHSSVSLAELLLAFGDPKDQRTGNFEVDDGMDAQREPLIFVDHPADIITWKDDPASAAFDEMTRRKTFAQPQKSNILTWKEMSNAEYNEKIARKKPPPRGMAQNSLKSQIVFDGELVPWVPPSQRTEAANGQQRINQLKSTEDMLTWSGPKTQKIAVEQQEPYKASFEKYRHDDRVPYVNE